MKGGEYKEESRRVCFRREELFLSPSFGLVVARNTSLPLRKNNGRRMRVLVVPFSFFSQSSRPPFFFLRNLQPPSNFHFYVRLFFVAISRPLARLFSSSRITRVPLSQDPRRQKSWNIRRILTNPWGKMMVRKICDRIFFLHPIKIAQNPDH